MSVELTDLIIESRFEPLRVYLDGVMTEDLMNGLIAVEDILDATEPKHRLLMTVFIKKYLILFRHNVEISSASTSASPQLLKDGHLYLKGKIASNDLKRASWWSPVVEIPKLAEVVVNPRAIVSMDLSHNYLSNKDLDDISTVLEELTSCRIVNLSDNRLKDDPDAGKLKRILAMHDDMKIILCGNALGSVDGKQFLSTLS